MRYETKADAIASADAEPSAAISKAIARLRTRWQEKAHAPADEREQDDHNGRPDQRIGTDEDSTRANVEVLGGDPGCEERCRDSRADAYVLVGTDDDAERMRRERSRQPAQAECDEPGPNCDEESSESSDTKSCISKRAPDRLTDRVSELIARWLLRRGCHCHVLSI